MSYRYREALRRLYNVRLFNPKSVGLDNMRRLYKALDFPMRGVPIVHVTGTNGKGSVSVKVAEGLRLAGLRTGLFTSPHIATFRERVQVDGDLISQDNVVEHLEVIQRICERDAIPSTFFEIVTALACLEFRQARVDVAVFEVGIGGRLDSTNVLDTSQSVITAVQMDHAGVLGGTRTKIATEKAGIFKTDVDALVAPGVPWDVVKARSIEVRAPLYRLEDVISPEEITHRMIPARRSSESRVSVSAVPANIAYASPNVNGSSSSSTSLSLCEEDTVGPLPEDAEKLNTDTARASLRLFYRRFRSSILSHLASAEWEAAVNRGVVSRPPCRFEVHRILPTGRKAAWYASKLSETETDANQDRRAENGGLFVVLDIAHNEAALLALSDKIQKAFPGYEVSVVFGICSDKAVPECVRAVLSMAPPARIRCVQSPSVRALSASELQNIVRSEFEKASDTNSAQLGRVSISFPPLASLSESIRASLFGPTHEESWQQQRFVAATEHRPSLPYLDGAMADGSSSEKRVVVVCGSAFLMSGARDAIGIASPTDDDYDGSTENQSSSRST